METYTLRVSLTNTEQVNGSPVPVSFENLLDVSKSGLPSDIRKEFHKLLDCWLDKIASAPDQFGFRTDAAFMVEYQGDTPDWVSDSARRAAEAKQLVRVRLSEVIKLARNNNI